MPNLNPSFVPFYDFEEFVNKAKTRLKVLELAKLTIHAYEFNWRSRLGAVTQKLSR